MHQVAAAQEYVNLMAEAFQVLSQVPDYQLYLLRAAEDDSSIGKAVKNQFSEALTQDVSVLLQVIRGLLDEMMRQSKDRRLSFAKAICLCMDQRISYSDDAEDPFQTWEGGRMHLHSLVPIWSDKKPAVVTTLNSNSNQTGICVAPKFPVSSAVASIGTETIRRNLASQSAPYGINGSLLNVSYYPCEKDCPEVHHIILPERPLREDVFHLPNETRIVFSPLTDRTNLLKEYEIEGQDIGGMRCRAIAVDGITDPNYIEARFKEIWLSACKKEPDIFFAPEMLATDGMARIENGGSVFLKPLLKAAAMEGWKAPRLTIMPTYWKNKSNRLLVFDETGRHLGTQFKRVPYVNQKDGKVEALDQPPKADVLMIHMKNQQRIAVVICAEFLASSKYVNDFLCGQLGATLILVPSYSPGERDFVDSLSTLKPYGTSVVWGNCCGAVHNREGLQAKRIIGGCSYAGMDELARFGLVSKCGFRCDGYSTCFFVVNIPTEIFQDKPDSARAPSVLHVCG